MLKLTQEKKKKKKKRNQISTITHNSYPFSMGEENKYEKIEQDKNSLKKKA